MTRKARRVSGVVDRRLNMRLTLDVEDIKSSTQEIAMLGQYGVNVPNFVEEAKKVVSEVNSEVKVKLKLMRSRKGVMRVKFVGLDLCSLLKGERSFSGKIRFKDVYNIAILLSEGEEDIEVVRRRCRDIGGTLLSMGVEVDEDI